jgi:Enoyl-(Acyl carrier protein) reductase
MRNYGAAKTGLIGLTRVLAAEADGLDIKINAVAPVAATRMMDYSMGSAAEVDNPEAEALMRPFLVRLDPALVSPVVAFLAHADCRVTGEIYTVGGGQVSRFFIGRTKGYYHPTLSVEDVRAHFDQIRDPADHTIPAGPAEEMADLYRAITSS